MTRLMQFNPTLIGYEKLFSELYDTKRIEKYPPHNLIKASDNEYILELAIAGYRKEDITISLEEYVLTISGQKQEEKVEFLFKGISSKSFSRSFTVSESAEVTSASYENGILTIRLRNVPKKAAIKKIDIV